MSDQETAMPDEQAAELRRLQAAASGPEDDALREEAEEVERVSNELLDRNAEGLSMLIDLAGPTLAQFGFPSVNLVLSHKDESGLTKGQVLASVWAPVLTKYGVDMTALGGQYKLEITALFVTLPIVKALRAAVMHDVQVKRAAEAVEQGRQGENTAELPPGAVEPEAGAA